METIYTRIREIQDGYRNWVTLSIYYGMCALVLVAAGAFLLRGDWEAALSTALIFFLMLVPSIVKGRYQLYLPFALELGIVGFTFLTLFLGGIAHFYDWVPFWDKFLHLQSGFLLGAAGYVVVYILNENKTTSLNLSPGFVSLFAVTFSLAIGVVWEVSEFFGDAVFGSSWQPTSSEMPRARGLPSCSKNDGIRDFARGTIVGTMNPYTLVILPIIAGFAAWYLLGSFKFAFFAFTLAVAIGVGRYLFRR